MIRLDMTCIHVLIVGYDGRTKCQFIPFQFSYSSIAQSKQTLEVDLIYFLYFYKVDVNNTACID